MAFIQTRPSMLPKKQAGFTLLELMIVVAIIGIISAIAYPSYQEHVRKAKRADAAASMMELAQFMERHYTANGRYLKPDGTAPDLPFAASPKDGGVTNYTLGFAANMPTASTFTLQATPTGSMSGDKCGVLTLANTGAKGQDSGATQADCWRR